MVSSCLWNKLDAHLGDLSIHNLQQQKDISQIVQLMTEKMTMPNTYFDIVDTEGFGQIEIGLKPAVLFYKK